MRSLMRLLGLSHEPPPHIQQAIDTAAAADVAATEAKVAVKRYWRARDVNDRANARMIDEYTAAERERQ